tara:strand:+ start:158 stop:349 length:192 start_codon:yes stop_codon:yes gene_type:complete
MLGVNKPIRYNRLVRKISLSRFFLFLALAKYFKGTPFLLLGTDLNLRSITSFYRRRRILFSFS